MQHGKAYRNAAAKVIAGQEYSPEEAFELLRANKTAKFDESVEVHAHLGINVKKSDEMVRSTVVLPNGTGRGKKVAVVTSTKEKEAREAGADVVGGEDLINDIKANKVAPGSAFDALLATPEMMPKLATVAKILGPKGLMPSPKTETVTLKIAETVEMLKKGKKVSFKNDDTGNVHQVIGKLSFTSEALIENYRVFREALDKAKSEHMKGRLVRSLSICSTMGPSVPIKL